MSRRLFVGHFEMYVHLRHHKVKRQAGQEISTRRLEKEYRSHRRVQQQKINLTSVNSQHDWKTAQGSRPIYQACKQLLRIHQTGTLGK